MTAPSPWGACPLGDGSWRFSIWAPAARHVALLLEGRELAMEPGRAGDWSCRIPARPGMAYLFRIDGRDLPDPASRAQIGGVESQPRRERSLIVATDAILVEHLACRR